MSAKSIIACAIVGLAGCVTYGEGETPAQDTSAATAVGKSCASGEVKAHDDFEGRQKPDDAGWAKGRVSDGLPTITTPSAKTTSVLTSKVAATTDEDARATAYIEREVPASGCFAVEFDVQFTEEAEFPNSAWTYFWWLDASDSMNLSLFRRANYVRLAAQRGGEELERIDVELAPNKWARVHIEVDLGSSRPVMSIAVGKTGTKKATLAEPLTGPYFTSFGAWSRGPVPAHQFLFDDVKLWY